MLVGMIRESLFSVLPSSDINDTHIEFGPVILEIICLIKIDTGGRQTDRKRESTFLYSRGHDTTRKHENSQSPDGLDHNTSLVCPRDVKTIPNTNLAPRRRHHTDPI